MKILVIGEICYDIFIKCRIDRLCPEAPVPVLNPIEVSENLGMAGNVISNLRSLSNGDITVNSLTPRHTMTKTRYLDNQTGYIVARVDEGDRIEYPFSQECALPANPKLDGIIISDYHKGFLAESDIAGIANYADEHGIVTFLDTKKMLGSFSENITFVKINEKEYKQQLSKTIYPERLCRNLIVTMGANGSRWVNQNKVVSVDPIAVSDVSGAGDTYLAAFALSYLRDIDGYGHTESVSRAMHFGNRAARIAVSRRGVVAVKYDEL